MYFVYASESDSPPETLIPRRFRTGDHAAGGCMSLVEEGYRILSMELPGGIYFPVSEIEQPALPKPQP